VRAFLPTRAEAILIQERVASALRLVQAYAPLRYACLQRDLPAILIGPTHNIAECHDQVGICLLQFDFVTRATTAPADIALTLVHEGMHARLTRKGFPYDEARRARIERLCVRAELIVARRIPGSDAAVRDAEARLKQPVEMWTDAAMREDNLRALERLGTLGRIGSWIARSVASVRRGLRGAA
jgi:hypothetical protein